MEKEIKAGQKVKIKDSKLRGGSASESSQGKSRHLTEEQSTPSASERKNEHTAARR